VAPGTAHEVDARGCLALAGFIDPASEFVLAIVGRQTSAVIPVSEPVVARWRQALGDPSMLEARTVEAWLASGILARKEIRQAHPGVACVLRFLRQPEVVDRHGTSLAHLATIAGLSPSRLMHVFTESVGIPLRRYLSWLRVQRAVRLIVAGASATEAAHIAGFADASHLTRTFRRTLGQTPRELIVCATTLRVLRLESITID
jgi:AraC-like DNA-binding protein